MTIFVTVKESKKDSFGVVYIAHILNEIYSSNNPSSHHHGDLPIINNTYPGYAADHEKKKQKKNERGRLKCVWVNQP